LYVLLIIARKLETGYFVFIYISKAVNIANFVDIVYPSKEIILRDAKKSRSAVPTV
jgi:hypothetical protein